jgi:DNA-binding MarR family transcriptional regulator
MPLDSLVANPGRLRILTALAPSGRQEFVALRQSTRLTDGNLASHARRLESAGLIRIDKQFRSGKPVTSFTLTQSGRSALESHVHQLVAAITPQPDAVVSLPDADEEWVD